MFSKVSLIAMATTIISLVFGILLAAFALYLIFATGLDDWFDAFHLYELFARIAIFVALVGFAAALIRTSSIPQRTEYGLRVYIILAIYCAGVLAALLDPFSPIREELNVIRYPTAIVLIIAGILFVRAALLVQRHVVLRVFSAGLGLLLIAAAMDEIFQFHERLSEVDDTYLNEATGISNQDMSTLFVALAGIIVALITRRIVRSFAKHGVLGAGGREVAASDLFLAAGIAFLAAMLLDTFDVVFTDIARAALLPILSQDHAQFVRQELNGYVETLANSVEELLEYAAAVLLLSTAIVYRSETR